MQNFRRKKCLFVFFILWIFSSVICADEIILFVGEGHNYDKATKGLVDAAYKIVFNTETEEYYFYTADSSTSAWIIFTEDDAEILRATLLKYKEWEEIAIANNVEIEKPLPNSEITGDVRWKTDDRVHSGKNIEMSAIFLSQSTDWHQFVLTSTTVESTTNGYFFRLEPIYLTAEQVDYMIDSFSPESIEAKLNEYSNLKIIENLFE